MRKPGCDAATAGAPPWRRIFCNRTLNLRSIGAIGYDMDYTLVHYRVEEWEQRSHNRLKTLLADGGWPVAHLEFDPDLVIRGLIVDSELGNLVKASRFGYIVRAFHGTRPMTFEEVRDAYSRTLVDLGEPRWTFLNTLFSLSEGCLFAQLVDLLDRGELPDVMGYPDLFRRVGRCLDEAHLEGVLKAEITADPERFVELDPDAPLALLDQRESGKRLLLISNSEWTYARAMMEFAFDPFLPAGTSWQDLFELVMVSARKPGFFATSLPLFKIVSPDGLLRPVPGQIPGPGAYLGGDAGLVESYLGLSGHQILYVGDHVWADVRVSKAILRWRTAMILRELEDELEAAEAFLPTQRELAAMMADKAGVEDAICQLRLLLQRQQRRYGPSQDASAGDLEARLAEQWRLLEELDDRIRPLAKAASEVGNSNWGPLMRAGIDKSQLARQVEGFADIYTSRVSNLLHASPFAYLRAHRGSLPHDGATALGSERDSDTGGEP